MPALTTLRRGALAAFVAVLLGASSAHAVSPDVVVSQVYGGGGNSGATLTNDYIELYNRGPATIDVTGWSVQYASSAGSSWQVTPLTGSIAPDGRYLVQEAAGSGGTTPLPTPNATGSIAMSAVAGKVALVMNQIALTTVCGGNCDAATPVRDFAGYGAANDFEGAGAAPGLSNTTAALRSGGATVDTDNNNLDFTAGTPAVAFVAAAAGRARAARRGHRRRRDGQRRDLRELRRGHRRHRLLGVARGDAVGGRVEAP